MRRTTLFHDLYFALITLVLLISYFAFMAQITASQKPKLRCRIICVIKSKYEINKIYVVNSKYKILVLANL